MSHQHSQRIEGDEERTAGFARRVTPRLLLAALAAALACLCLEGLHRGLLAWRETPWDSGAAAESMRREVDFTGAFTPKATGEPDRDGAAPSVGVLHPFTASEKQHDTGDVLAQFRAGFQANEYVVVVVGGSVAGGWAKGMGAKFAATLGQELRLRGTGRRVRVLNYAHAAYKEPQQLMRVAYLFSLGYVPDALINLDGFNEVAGGAFNASQGRNPIYPSFSVWGGLLDEHAAFTGKKLGLMFEIQALRLRTQQLVDRSLAWQLHRSSILGTWQNHRLNGWKTERFRLQKEIEEIHVARMGFTNDRTVKGPDFTMTKAAVLDLCVDTWFESSVSISAICRARDVFYLHVLQPTLLDEGSKPLSPKERGIHTGPEAWTPAIRGAYPALRRRGQELEQRGIAFLDLSLMFADVPETVYNDTVHLKPRGVELMTTAVTQAFIERMPDL